MSLPITQEGRRKKSRGLLEVNLRSKLVDFLDVSIPKMMVRIRHTVHVKMKKNVTYPLVLDHVLDELTSRQDVAVDVGANRGIFAFDLCQKFKSCVAIEPIEPLAMSLRRSLPKNAHVRQLAIGAELGEITLRVPIDEQGNTNFALSTASTDNQLQVFSKTNVVEYRVPQDTLDHILEGFGKIGFIKIDVEGFEGTVLDSGLETLKTHKPILLIEIFSGYNAKFREVFKLLDDLGYAFYCIEKSSLRLGVSEDLNILEKLKDTYQGIDSSGQVDFLFVDRQHSLKMNKICARLNS
jgi:FkbM family methyltransferase